jgi:hypothetical protein
MHAGIEKQIFMKSSRMITSGSTRDCGVVRRLAGKVVKTAMTPKRLHGLHAGDRSVWDWWSKERVEQN